MNTIINLPYQIGQKLYISRIISKCIRIEKICICNTLYYKEYKEKPIYKSEWIVEEKYLKEIQIDEEEVTWTFADNEDLTDNDQEDENHYYAWYRDNEINIFIDKNAAEDYALSLNVMNELCK